MTSVYRRKRATAVFAALEDNRGNVEMTSSEMKGELGPILVGPRPLVSATPA
jgi:hypothetical protein